MPADACSEAPPMQHIRIQLPDEVYWWLFAEAARARTKAHEHAALILTRAYEAEQPVTQPANGDQPAA